MNIHVVNKMENKNLDKAVLGFLIKGPVHGYQLHKEISDPAGIGGVWHIKIGKMYSMLKNLEEQGLIRATTEKEGNRPQKKTYYLTKQGKSAYKKWMINPIKHGRDLRIIFLIKIYFVKRWGFNNWQDMIFKQKTECERWKERNRYVQTKNHEKKSFSSYVKKYRLSQIDGFIKWLDWCEEMINEEI